MERDMNYDTSKPQLLTGIQGQKPLCDMKLGEFFLTQIDRKIVLCFVLATDLSVDRFGVFPFHYIETVNNVLIFEPSMVNMDEMPRLSSKVVVTPLRNLNFDVSLGSLSVVDFALSETSDNEARRVGNLSFAEPIGLQDEFGNALGFVTPKTRSIGGTDDLRILGAQDSGNARRATWASSLQFSEWHGLIGDRRFFTVRAGNLGAEND